MELNRVNLDLRIADLNITIHSFPDRQLIYATNPYLAEFDKPDYDITVIKTTEKIEASNGKKLTDMRMINWYLTADKTYELNIFDPNLDCIILKAECNLNNGCSRMLFLDVPAVFNTPAGLPMFMALEMIIHIIMIYNNGFVFHASSIAYKGEGIAFSALPGTGKSTHTSLWLKNYSNDVKLLNDDKPILRYIEGEGWYIYGSPWAGSTGKNTNLKVPLRALVFLERGKENKIRELSTLEAITRFFEAVIHPMTDNITDAMLKSLGHLIEENMLCLITCNMEDEAAEVARKFLFENKEK